MKAVLVSLLLLTGSAQALAESYFVRGQLGYASADMNAADFAVDKVSVESVDDSDTGLGIEFGYRLNDQWSLKLGYLELGESSLSITSDTLTPEAFAQSVAELTPVLGEGVSIAAAYRLWHKDSVSLNAELGAFIWQSDTKSVSQVGQFSSSDDGTDMLWGVSLDYQLSSNWQLAVGYKAFMLEETVSYPHIALQYHF